MNGTVVEANDLTADHDIIPAVDLPEKETHFTIALQRILNQGCPVDPQTAAAPFNSAF